MVSQVEHQKQIQQKKKTGKSDFIKFETSVLHRTLSRKWKDNSRNEKKTDLPIKYLIRDSTQAIKRTLTIWQKDRQFLKMGKRFKYRFLRRWYTDAQ